MPYQVISHFLLPLILQHLADGDMTMSQAWVDLVERLKAIGVVREGTLKNNPLRRMTADIAAEKGITGNSSLTQILRHVLKLQGCGLYVADAARACLLGLPPGSLHPPRGRSKKVLPATRQKMAVDVPNPVYTGQAVMDDKLSIIAAAWLSLFLCLSLLSCAGYAGGFVRPPPSSSHSDFTTSHPHSPVSPRVHTPPPCPHSPPAGSGSAAFNSLLLSSVPAAPVAPPLWLSPSSPGCGQPLRGLDWLSLSADPAPCLTDDELRDRDRPLARTDRYFPVSGGVSRDAGAPSASDNPNCPPSEQLPRSAAAFISECLCLLGRDGPGHSAAERSAALALLRQGLAAHPTHPELLRLRLSLTARALGFGSAELEAARREAMEAMVTGVMAGGGSRGCGQEYQVCLALVSVEPTWQGAMRILQKGKSPDTLMLVLLQLRCTEAQRALPRNIALQVMILN